MRSRNRFMADHSNRCIAYLSRMQGGTLYTVNYALESGVPVENLADTMAMLD
jgi:predicted Rossmann fold nucleotide-binding protein DprA/Smf involved in DNA uptake